ncbi:unnamed protein product, partial [Musa textilis]
MASSSTSYTPVIVPAGNNSSSQSPSLITINAAALIPFKLSKSGNYASWRAQFSNLLFGYDLIGYIDGSLHCPPAVLNSPGGSSPIPNPAHKLWLRQDRLILQAIQASVAGSVAPLISSCMTAAEAWSKLQTTLANRSRTRMLGLLSSLMKVKQEGSTIADYLQNIKVIIDDLTLIGHSLSEEEVLVHTLNGLGDEYKELAAAIRARDSPISFEELYDKLTDYETYLKRDDRLPGPTITAQVSHRSRRKSNQYNKRVNQGPTKLPPDLMGSTPNPSHPHYQGDIPYNHQHLRP